MSLTTESSLTLASVSVFWMRWACRVCSRTICLRVRISVRSSCTSSSGTKLARTRPNAARSASHMASFMSVLRPGAALTWAALATARVKSPSLRIFQIGIQYTPVASIATWLHPNACSHASNASTCSVVVPNVRHSRLARPASATRTHATTVSLWTSRPPTLS